MDNPSEYLVLLSRGPDHWAVLLDANLERIAEYNADAPEVRQLLEDAKELGTVGDNDWEKVFSRLGAEEREQAKAYRLHE